MRGYFRLVVVLLVSTFCFGAVTPDEARQWQQDLQYFHDHAAEVHRNLFHDMKPAQFDAAVADLQKQVPTLSRNQIIVGLMRIVAMIDDGHSHIPFDASEGFHHLPIRLWQFSDGLYVVAGDKKYAEIVGGRVVRFGNTPVDEVLKAASTIAPHDNAMTIKARVQYSLTFPEVLNGLGVIGDPSHVPITVTKDGKEITASIEPESFDYYRDRHDFALPAGWVDACDPSAPVPLWQRHPDDLYWFDYDPKEKLLYVQYNAVQQKKDESIADFFARVMAFANSHPVDKFVLDLRQNGGGNNYFNLPIIHDFIRSDAVNQPGKLFTIIGRQTFSAAGNLTNEMRINTNTMFVGEPSGFRPNMYGDPAALILPNSKIKVMLSTLWWQDNDPRDNRPWQAPDLAVESSFADYRAGRDPVLEVVLRAKAEKPIAAQLQAYIDANHPEEAHQALTEYLADPLHRYVNVEQQLNNMGYEYLGRHDVNRAIEVFKLNVEAYPQSWNVYDSLGEAYLASGDRALAKENYRRSLELNPKNQTARDVLAQGPKGS